MNVQQQGGNTGTPQPMHSYLRLQPQGPGCVGRSMTITLRQSEMETHRNLEAGDLGLWAGPDIDWLCDLGLRDHEHCLTGFS